MRKTLGVAALMLALCCPALAGEIPNPPAPEEPAVTADGIIQTGQPEASDDGGIIHGDNTDPLTQLVLTLFASVLP